MSPAHPAVAFETPPAPCAECSELQARGVEVLLCRRCGHNLEVAQRFRSSRRLDLVRHDDT